MAVTAANTADRHVIDELLDQPATGRSDADTDSGIGEPAADPGDDGGSGSEGGVQPKRFEVYGDSAYADGATLNEQAVRGHDMRAKVPPVRNANGYSKDQFTIDLAAGTVTCPARHTVTIGMGARHRSARFGALCQSCPLRADCTTARRGRVISIHPHEAALQRAKAANSTRPGSRTTGNIVPSWNARSATSPTAPGAPVEPAAADTPAS